MGRDLPIIDPAAEPSARRHPDWIRARMPSGEMSATWASSCAASSLNTVCEEARCPNIGECWDQRTATFMILGDTCTRACGFCAVKTGPARPGSTTTSRGAWPRPSRPWASSTSCVTRVARDDLPDGGARIFAETIRGCARGPGMGIEVLIPDFDG